MRPAKDFLPKGAKLGISHAHHPSRIWDRKIPPRQPRVEFEFFSYRQKARMEDSYCNGPATRLLTPHKIANATAQLARKQEARQGGKPLKCGATKTHPAPITRRASKAGSHPKRIRSTSTSEPCPGRIRNESAIGCIESRQHASPADVLRFHFRSSRHHPVSNHQTHSDICAARSINCRSCGR